MDLSGRVAIVTGGGRGLGLAYAEALAGAGAAVVVNDLDPASAEDTAAGIVEAGGKAVAHAGAIGGAEVADALVERAVAEFGRLDVLVTNAGVLRDKVLWKMTDDDFDTVVDVHLRGTFTCARAAARQLRTQGEGGRLILVGSPAGQRGNFGQTNYSAAKAGIAAFARTWSMELARAEITVNAVIPVAATAMTETIPALRGYAEAIRAGEPVPSFARTALAFGTPEDAAGLVVFLASAEAAGITGQCVGIGGDRLSLWSHPRQVAAAYADGGWSADDIAAAWSTTVGAQPQSVGENLPEPR
ncbi:3-oxoacyl-ACP reductase [Prauserella marina]|uniref:NAD(P)-dependent dehydrogenase, short-chain alcohol dehydrogenase family n=1 Tax=Prauserella marina TaxID=530584 RepID=A0A222VN42_9PSEU|nr:SDR family NAD(P)-dependent oxidoreductase [Prauserella marina]ASR35317.1 3-oxoacyl-ACP reductase [Prauserella marina]PWV84897.1 NAD(P)-dependent dehydrogenase (short-subunit alcohol dehydrogenase family) [Prauserella marina]SDC10103.1 NAD(P)-dependent dehydrogenase, short-chain alcohol dehydrogenase family [Prauserella marina]